MTSNPYKVSIDHPSESSTECCKVTDGGAVGLLAHLMCTVVSGQINPDWDYLQANQMSISFKTDNLICSF